MPKAYAYLQGLTSEKLKPSLEGYKNNANSPTENRELAKSLIILGPQEHDGHRYKAVRADTGETFQNLPVDKDLNFDLTTVRIAVENVPPPAAPAQ